MDRERTDSVKRDTAPDKNEGTVGSRKSPAPFGPLEFSSSCWHSSKYPSTTYPKIQLRWRNGVQRLHHSSFSSFLQLPVLSFSLLGV